MMEINQSEGCQPAAHHSAVQTVKNARGFTLIELIMVMAILGVLSSLAYSSFYGVKNRTMLARAQSEIRNIEKDIYAFASEKGSYPASLSDINRQEDLDPWGNRYVYVPDGNPASDPVGNRMAFGRRINTDFDLYSKGGNGVSTDNLDSDESADDVVRGGEGSFTDLAPRWGI